MVSVNRIYGGQRVEEKKQQKVEWIAMPMKDSHYDETIFRMGDNDDLCGKAIAKSCKKKCTCNSGDSDCFCVSAHCSCTNKVPCTKHEWC